MARLGRTEERSAFGERRVNRIQPRNIYLYPYPPPLLPTAEVPSHCKYSIPLKIASQFNSPISCPTRGLEDRFLLKRSIYRRL